MLDRMVWFSKSVGRNNKVIGLTATTESDLNLAERAYFTAALKFKLYDSKIPQSLGDRVKPQFKTLEDFLSDTKIASMGKIIYCEDSFKNSFPRYEKTVHENVSDLERLRNIQPGHLYLVTE